jgi:hypothetical protein
MIVQPVPLPEELPKGLEEGAESLLRQSSVPLQGPATWSSKDWSLSTSLYRQPSVPSNLLQRQKTQPSQLLATHLEGTNLSRTRSSLGQTSTRAASRATVVQQSSRHSVNPPGLDSVKGVPYKTLRRDTTNPAGDS